MLFLFLSKGSLGLVSSLLRVRMRFLVLVMGMFLVLALDVDNFVDSPLAQPLGSVPLFHVFDV